MGYRDATLGVMSKSPNARRIGGPLSWDQLSRPDAEQCQRFLAESLSLLLGDVLRAILSDASPSVAADESAIERYRNLADSLADGESRRRTGLGTDARRPRQTLRDLAEIAADPDAECPVHGGNARICRCAGPVSGALRQRALGSIAPGTADMAVNP